MCRVLSEADRGATCYQRMAPVTRFDLASFRSVLPRDFSGRSDLSMKKTKLDGESKRFGGFSPLFPLCFHKRSMRVR